MAQRLSDRTSGEVVIRSGPPASGGGWAGVGGIGGGNRVGASGNFGGPSARTKALRKRAKQEHKERQARERAQAAANALELARIQTRQQLLAGLTQRQADFKAESDRNFAVRFEQLTQSLEHEISAARTRPDIGAPSEPWQLYSINKTKSEIDGLIVRKTAKPQNSMNETGLRVHTMDMIHCCERLLITWLVWSSSAMHLRAVTRSGKALITRHMKPDCYRHRSVRSTINTMHSTGNMPSGLKGLLNGNGGVNTPSSAMRVFVSSSRPTRTFASSGSSRPTPVVFQSSNRWLLCRRLSSPAGRGLRERRMHWQSPLPGQWFY